MTMPAISEESEMKYRYLGHIHGGSPYPRLQKQRRVAFLLEFFDFVRKASLVICEVCGGRTHGSLRFKYVSRTNWEQCFRSIFCASAINEQYSIV